MVMVATREGTASSL